MDAIDKKRGRKRKYNGSGLAPNNRSRSSAHSQSLRRQQLSKNYERLASLEQQYAATFGDKSEEVYKRTQVNGYWLTKSDYVIRICKEQALSNRSNCNRKSFEELLALFDGSALESAAGHGKSRKRYRDSARMAGQRLMFRIEEALIMDKIKVLMDILTEARDKVAEHDTTQDSCGLCEVCELLSSPRSSGYGSDDELDDQDVEWDNEVDLVAKTPLEEFDDILESVWIKQSSKTLPSLPVLAEDEVGQFFERLSVEYEADAPQLLTDALQYIANQL